jgi:hypothetical protein
MPLSPRTHGANESIEHTGRKLDSSNNTKEELGLSNYREHEPVGGECQDGEMAVIELICCHQIFSEFVAALVHGIKSVSKFLASVV